MANYPLIRDYILAFDAAVPPRPDVADLRDELTDHLIEAVDRLCASGIDLESAQHSALDRFGEPAVFAGMIIAVPAKGNTMYTFFTRGAGYFAFTAAALWVAAAAAIPFALDGVLIIWAHLREAGSFINLSLLRLGPPGAKRYFVAARNAANSVASVRLPA